MPPSRSILICVTLATILDILSFSAGDFLLERVWDNIPAGEFGKSTNETNVASNVTVASNSTLSNLDATASNKKHSYGFRLAQKFVTVIILNIMLYHWNIWLERKFPTRSQSFAAAPVQDRGEKDEQVEEEIIQKWIAQGKIKRASVNWGNTFIKWGLHMSLGFLMESAVRTSIEEMAAFRKGKFFDITLYNLAINILIGAVFGWFSILPLASLIGFVIVPAPKRVVYGSAISCLWSIFFAAFLGVFAPWIQRQALMFEESAANTTANGTFDEL